MSKDLNNITLIGRLVKQPEIKYTANGTAVAKFSIAVNDSFKQNNEWKDSVNFFDIVVWGNTAKNCNDYLQKGSQIAVEGCLKQNRWTDQNGQNRSKVEINANRVQFLTKVEQKTAPVHQEQQQNFNDPWQGA